MNVELLKQEMKNQRIGVDELAERTGIDRSALYRRFKCGGDKITVSEAKRIADALSLGSDMAMSIFLPQKSH